MVDDRWFDCSLVEEEKVEEEKVEEEKVVEIWYVM